MKSTSKDTTRAPGTGVMRLARNCSDTSGGGRVTTITTDGRICPGMVVLASST